MVKRNGLKMFDLTSDEKANPQKLVAFTKRIPALAKVSDKRVKQRKEVQRKSFIKAVNIMWRNPSIAPFAESWLEDQAKVEGLVADDSVGLAASSQLQFLDDDFTCAFLVKESGLTKQGIESLCGHDPAEHLHIVEWGLVALPSLKIPEEGRSADVLSAAFGERSVAVGRLKTLNLETCCKTDGSFNWKDIGVYAVKTEGGYVVEITHRPSGDKATLTEKDGITTAWVLTKNWSDFGACFKLRKALTQPLHDFFGEGTGPHHTAAWQGNSRHFNDKISYACKRVSEKKAAAKADKYTTPQKRFRQDSKEQAHTESLQKARKGMAAKNGVLAGKREQKLG